ncbi:YceI family protein [Flavobacterium caseinilyticum]|uniref:YceI family protein n=1 Tax=Flavobacterium caseinilyticum TaxID=2541732 RepID=A0A4R5AU69_9FLAO|nr:YceI family protein [Flavobacterium caseinilyticum]TDD75246.1 YceI family protein [Flavobacterium caseinilyticum]
MKKITLILLLFIASATTAQEKMLSYGGIINFEASIPLFEEVKARNEKTTCILITKTGQFFCWTNIKDFKFERSLMEEHFNKNYMESHRFPRAYFKGRIEKFDLKNITNDAKLHQINGKITIRGLTKKMLITGTLKKVSNGIEFYCAFPLNTDDLKIEIPSVVRSKISKNVNTQIICLLQ